MHYRPLERVAVALVVLSLVMPARLVTASESFDSIVLDVVLSSAGALEGQVVDAQGQPRENVPVIVSQSGVEVARTTTTAEGQFAVSELSGGLYAIESEGGVVSCRAWTASAAPPVAQPGLLLVANEQVERGHMIRPFHGAMLVTLGIAGIVVAASLDDDDSSN